MPTRTYRLTEFMDEIEMLQTWHPEMKFKQGLWGYKEVGCVLGLSPKTVLKPKFWQVCPPVTLWQAEGTDKKAGQQVLRWKPLDVLTFREEKKDVRVRRMSHFAKSA